MSIFDIIVLAIALSIDAMIVSFSNGLIFRNNKIKDSLGLAFTVGWFQFAMPIIGFFFAQVVTQYVKPYSHFLVFGIFVFLGIKFIKDSFEEHDVINHDFDLKYIITIGIATSIDALFAGVSISFSGISIWNPSLIIGLITFINSMIGFWIAGLLRSLKTKFLEITGGLILILLGFKVLLMSLL